MGIRNRRRHGAVKKKKRGNLKLKVDLYNVDKDTRALTCEVRTNLRHECSLSILATRRDTRKS